MKKSIIFVLFFMLFFTAGPVFAQLQTDSNTINTRVGNPPNSPGGTAPPAPSNIKQGILDTFGITMNGFDSDHLQWAWGKFWEAGSPFTDKLRGTRIEANGYSGISYKTSNPCFDGSVTLYMAQYTKDFYKFMLGHELGHVLEGCNPRSVTHQVEQMNAFDAEGGISFYARNALLCFPDGSVSNYNEDYADMLAYYIDRSAGYRSAPDNCGTKDSNPPNPPNPYNGSFSKHLSVAQSILQ